MGKHEDEIHMYEGHDHDGQVGHDHDDHSGHSAHGNHDHGDMVEDFKIFYISNRHYSNPRFITDDSGFYWRGLAICK